MKNENSQTISTVSAECIFHRLVVFHGWMCRRLLGDIFSRIYLSQVFPSAVVFVKKNLAKFRWDPELTRFIRHRNFVERIETELLQKLIASVLRALYRRCPALGNKLARVVFQSTANCVWSPLSPILYDPFSIIDSHFQDRVLSIVWQIFLTHENKGQSNLRLSTGARVCVCVLALLQLAVILFQLLLQELSV